MHAGFEGNRRFSIHRLVGSGGMGAVYEAYDNVTGQTVALKTLLGAEPSALFRLKNEFRSLADIAHPNLVCLFELFIEEDSSFFTMELVDGSDFVSYVTSRALGHSGKTGDTLTETLKQPTALSPVSTWIQGRVEPGTHTGRSPADPAKLLPALRQLAEGLCALHEGGKLHRDIKPSNILVSRAGRVVILDFGLVTEMGPLGDHATVGFVGTPAYSSPEQTKGDALTPASDWYGVGVTLYQALTGRLPFHGSYLDVMMQKQGSDPVSPSQVATDVDPALESLCMDLLQRNPEARPTGPEVLRRVTAKATPAPAARHASRSFVGRDAALSHLWDAFRGTKAGRTTKVLIHGTSGMGKSTLVRNFIHQLEGEHALVVSGRCYESESIPYKALDGVVDQLTHYLVSLPAVQAQALLPRDIASMAKMFPVLARVEAIAGYVYSAPAIQEPLTLRRRALSSLRELLARIGDRMPLVMFIDDLHWSDLDSITLLENLLRPPDAPALLLLTTFRTEQVARTPFLQAWLDETDGKNCVEIRVEALTPAETKQLVNVRLGKRAPASDDFIETVLREAQGNPFLVEQFARWATTVDEGSFHHLTIGQLLEANMRRLPGEARELLKTLSVAARPVSPNVAFRASGFPESVPSLISLLRAEDFLRGSAAQPLELYHDRIREGIAAQLSAGEVRRIHSNLAESLSATGFDDPEVLFEHHHGAQQLDLAAKYALLSAAKASVALAFDRATSFYRWALELVPHPAEELVSLKTDMAQSLANAGRPSEAARVFLDAAKGAEPARALDLERRAAEQLLVGGHVDDGLEVIRAVLARVGLQLAPGPKSALFSLLRRRLQLRARGLSFTETAISEIAPRQLLHIDICWGVSIGLAMVDNIRGADFQTRHLLLALRAGEPYRIARAFAMEAGFSATSGGPGRKRAARFLRMAEELSARVANPHAAGITTLIAGVCRFLIGEWRKAFEHCEAAYEILHDQCTGVLWETTSAQLFILGSLLYLGEFREASRRLPALLAAANERGNLYAATEFRTRINFLWLVADDAMSARRDLDEARRLWSHRGFHRQHYVALQAETHIELYTGNPQAAYDLMAARWDDLNRSMLMRIQVLRIEALDLRARGAVGIAAQRPDRARRMLKEAARLAFAIEGERMPWSNPMAWTLQASIAALKGGRSRAADLLASAVAAFAEAGMNLHAAAAKARLGEISGDEAMSEDARQALDEMGVKNHSRMIQLITPGFGPAASRSLARAARIG